ncbi:MAG: hypothetical protein KKE02_11525 [Alphaproteobacteria bacterium]|nr:hypothetical protein [Alphaproteobacteria bacterium]MBU1514225.1 hypothetical protein [Alphaproteobacteria bacterium]MBU2095875.1 hypothetical protein [Alphaproteobacteria bacterium]MBU2151641.1 hypothetical protein [Alphaproteobacteria bacterium]MBU2307111.1 hypothetical protein [Alphaproteobacteria bacterium]
MLVLLAVMTVAATPTAPVSAADARPHMAMIDSAARPVCKSNGRYEIADPALLYRQDGKAKMANLGKLPKANHEKAVLRTVDGCAAPVVVGYEVGR